MNFPSFLQETIDQLILTESSKALQRARQKLTDRYQSGIYSSVKAQLSSHFIKNQKERLTYLATRMPATYAVCTSILNLLKNEASSITSFLDLGTGPGTAFWAAQNIFFHLKNVTLIEQDGSFIELGKYFLQQSSVESSGIIWKKESLLKAVPFASHDLVTLSYVLGELSFPEQMNVIQAAWNATENALVVIEPGTPQGFERIRNIRQFLIDQGAFIMAPCPHSDSCPMIKQNWCHFSQRLERQSTHRLIKKTSRGFEDEKYSYVIARRFPIKSPSSRILSHPQRKKGHYILDLCTQNGLKRHIISKSMTSLYLEARHYEWGDPGPDIGN